MSKEIVDILANIEKVSGTDLSRLQTVLESEFNTSGRDLDQTEDKRSEEAKRIVIKVIRNGVILGVNYDVATKKLSFVDEEAKVRYKILKDAIIFRSKVSFARTLESHISSSLGVNLDEYKRLLIILEDHKDRRVDDDDMEIVIRIGKQVLDPGKKDEILIKIFGKGDDAQIVKKFLSLIKEAFDLFSKRVNIASYESDKSEHGGEFVFKKPSLGTPEAYIQEWERLWNIHEVDKRKFIDLVRRTLVSMENDIGKFSIRKKFTDDNDSAKYIALKKFIADLGYYVDDNGLIVGREEDDDLGKIALYLHSRLALADQAHMNGVGGNMSIDYKAAFEETIPDFGRFIPDFFTGTHVELDSSGLAETREKESYEHYRVVRVFDQMMTLYYDEMPDGYVQKNRNEFNSSGKPEMEYKGTVYVARTKEGLFITESENESQLRLDNPSAVIEEKYGQMYVATDSSGKVHGYSGDVDYLRKTYPSLIIEPYKKEGKIADSIVKPGRFAFGTGEWMSSSKGRHRAEIKLRLLRDFAAIQGVKRTFEDGEVVFYYGEDSSENAIRITQSELETTLNIAMDFNSLCATREQIFTAFYSAMGNSPQKGESWEHINECYPLAKEINVCKETIMEIPYIVLGGDVPNEFFLHGCLRTGLIKEIITKPELADALGIHSQEEFEKPIINEDGLDDFKGLAAIRNISSHELENRPTLYAKLKRIRNILISIHVSRLKRDLLKLRFIPYTVDRSGNPVPSEMRLYGHFAAEREEDPDKKGHEPKRFPVDIDHDKYINNRHFLGHLVAPPRYFLAEYGRTLDDVKDPWSVIDLRGKDTSKGGRAATKGDQIHEAQLGVHELYSNMYKHINSPLPEMSGHLDVDIKSIIADLTKMFAVTSPLKSDPLMVDWVTFYEVVDMRLKRLIFAYKEKYEDVFLEEVREYGDVLTFMPYEDETLISELRRKIASSGQLGVGGDYILVDDNGSPISLVEGLLNVIPDEKPSFNPTSMWQNVISVFNPRSPGYNEDTPIGRAKGGLYVGGIEQRVGTVAGRRTNIERRTHPYFKALHRYGLTGFEKPQTAVLTNTGLLNTDNKAVSSAKSGQDSEEKKAKGE